MRTLEVPVSHFFLSHGKLPEMRASLNRKFVLPELSNKGLFPSLHSLVGVERIRDSSAKPRQGLGFAELLRIPPASRILSRTILNIL